MKLKEHLNRIAQLDQLVRMKATGTPDELAEKLNISRSMLYYFVEVLKDDLGFPLKYCRTKRTFYYTKAGSFICKFEEDLIENEIIINGGKNVNNIFRPIQLDKRLLSLFQINF